jgi:hypothetical protein
MSGTSERMTQAKAFSNAFGFALTLVFSIGHTPHLRRLQPLRLPRPALRLGRSQENSRGAFAHFGTTGIAFTSDVPHGRRYLRLLSPWARWSPALALLTAAACATWRAYGRQHPTFYPVARSLSDAFISVDSLASTEDRTPTFAALKSTTRKCPLTGKRTFGEALAAILAMPELPPVVWLQVSVRRRLVVITYTDESQADGVPYAQSYFTFDGKPAPSAGMKGLHVEVHLYEGLHLIAETIGGNDAR